MSEEKTIEAKSEKDLEQKEEVVEVKSEKDLEEKEEVVEVEVEEKASPKNSNIIKTSEVKTGMYVKVYQVISELDSKGKEKTRTQAFEGLIIRRKHGNESGATFTVRKEYKTGHVVEKIYPINLPSIEKVELIKKLNKVNRSKILFVRYNKKKKLKYQAV
jgi:ribosomal protein L19